MPENYRNIAKSVRLTDQGWNKVQPRLPPGKEGNPLYEAIARRKDAPSKNTVARILEREQGVNHSSLVQFWLALGLALGDLTEADWEPCPKEAAQEEREGYRTVVFTDMEGSSEGYNRFGDRFLSVLQRHTALLMEIAGRCQGEVIQSMGDGLLLVFDNAANAAHFAIETQKALLEEGWSTLCAEVKAVSVRIGIHTGRVLITRDAVTGQINYSGPTVNLAARVVDAAHAGQVLVCDTTQREIRVRLGKSERDFKDCGQHRLKDFELGVWLWQLLDEALKRDFDPIIRKPSPVRPTASPPRAAGRKVPHPPGDYFVGRDDLLEELHEAFRNEDRDAWKQALTGKAGIGKKTIAGEYDRRYGDGYEEVFWLSGASEEELMQSLCRVAKERKLFVEDTTNDSQYIAAAQGYIGRESNLLVILPNLRYRINYFDAFPDDIAGRLLVTTDRPHRLWKHPAVRRRAVEPLDITDAARYLVLRSGREAAAEEAEALAEAVQCEPGGLTQAALALRRDRGLAFQGQTEEIRRANLKDAYKYAPLRGLLRNSLFLAPDAIPEAFAEEFCRLQNVDWRKVLAPLQERGLVRWDRGAGMYHVPLYVQEMALEDLDTALRTAHAGFAIKLLEKLFPRPKSDTWPQCERLILHALACARNVADYGLKGKEAGLLISRAYVYLRQRSRHEAAEPLMQTVRERMRELELTPEDLERIAEDALYESEEDRARSLSKLGNSYQRQGRYAEAEPLLRQALAIRQKVLPQHHPDIGVSLNNLATLYDDLGRYAEAEPLYEQALVISEQALGVDPVDIANYLRNLAEQEQLEERTRQILPDIAISLNNLGYCYMMQGLYEDALRLYERALAIREQALGPDHPDTAISLNNVAALYDSQGRYEDALPLLQRALAIREQALGPDHPDIAQSLNNLAGLYDSQGRYAEAEPLYKQALAIREQALGPDHPDTAQSLNNLAVLYNSQGRYEDALPLLERAFAIRLQVLGPHHPDSQQVANNRLRCLQEAGREEEARQFRAEMLRLGIPPEE